LDGNLFKAFMRKTRKTQTRDVLNKAYTPGSLGPRPPVFANGSYGYLRRTRWMARRQARSLFYNNNSTEYPISRNAENYQH